MNRNSKWILLSVSLAVLFLVGLSLFPIGTYAQGGVGGNGWMPYGTYSGWGMMNGANGMDGCFGDDDGASGPRLTLEEASAIAQTYAEKYGAATPLEVKEVMEFEDNFYAQISEEDTGIGAFEILIDPVTGDVHPEPGPNMMWNTKYGMHNSGVGGMMGGMMGGFGNGMGWGSPRQGASAEMPISPEEALSIARSYLSQSRPGLEVGDEVARFYGYYTLHTLKDGEIAGMFSVNGYTGQIWFHDWHGDFVGMTETLHD